MGQKRSTLISLLALFFAMCGLLLVWFSKRGTVNYASEMAIFAMMPVALALVLLMVFEGMAGVPTRMHGWAAYGTGGVSFLAILLQIVFLLPPVQSGLRSYDLSRAGDQGFALKDPEPYLWDPDMRVEILSSKDGLEKLQRSLMIVQPTSSKAKYHEALHDALILYAGHRRQGTPIDTLLANRRGRMLALLAMVAETRPPKKDMKWLAKLVQLAPQGRFKVGVMQAATAQQILKKLVEGRGSLNLSTDEGRLVVLALTQFGHLLSSTEIEGMLTFNNNRLGASSKLKGVTELRKQLRQHYGTKKKLGVDVTVSITDTRGAKLKEFAKESVYGLLRTAGFEVTSGRDLLVTVTFGKDKAKAVGFTYKELESAKKSVALKATQKKSFEAKAANKAATPKKEDESATPTVKKARPTRTEDRLVFEFLPDKMKAEKFVGEVPGDGKVLGRQIELPVRVAVSGDDGSWLWGIPSFMLDTKGSAELTP